MRDGGREKQVGRQTLTWAAATFWSHSMLCLFLYLVLLFLLSASLNVVVFLSHRPALPCVRPTPTRDQVS